MQSRLVQILLSAGCSPEDADALANFTPGAGDKWVARVLDSRKVDEFRFLEALAKAFGASFQLVDANLIERSTLGVLPSRFVFQYELLPVAATEQNATLATYDLFNTTARQLAPISARTASILSRLRPLIVTFAPFRARCSAAPRPRPEPPPVMTTESPETPATPRPQSLGSCCSTLFTTPPSTASCWPLM